MPPSHRVGHEEKLRIAVLGYIVRGPLGGLAWHHLQYVLGLHDLGHEVAFIEDSGDSGWSCYRPDTGEMVDDPSYGLRWTEQLFERAGLPGRFAYFDAPKGTWHGPFASQAEAYCSTADVVLNVSAVNSLRPWVETAGRRVLVDTDPVFTQVRHLTDPAARRQAANHDAFFTFGERFGQDAGIPDDGFAWRPTRQPVVVDRWRVVEPPPLASYTTVMQWDSYPSVEFGGVRYGMKSESFEFVADLPASVKPRIEWAVGSRTAPLDRLEALGWHPVNSRLPTIDAWTFQEYVRASRGEFTVAKQGYVVSRSGWFSERSANYLASGRPVITQDTGFTDFIPIGDGLFAFSSKDGAVAALEAVEADYERHGRAARALAHEYFGHAGVLGDLLDQSGSGLLSGRILSPGRPTAPRREARS